MRGCTRARTAVVVGAIIGVAILQFGCAHPNVRALSSFKAARKRGDIAMASSYLAPDARSWWEKKEGAGRPLTAKRTKGRWADWDHYFNAQTKRGAYVVDEGSATVSYEFTEINDFYRLIGREPTKSQYVYYFNRDGKICGKLFDPMREHRGPDRFDEFEEWARANRPDELIYLMPEGDIIPNLDRAKRWRMLLGEWREAVGLPAIACSHN
jgi:hypothetical protein